MSAPVSGSAPETSRNRRQTASGSRRPWYGQAQPGLRVQPVTQLDRGQRVEAKVPEGPRRYPARSASTCPSTAAAWARTRPSSGELRSPASWLAREAGTRRSRAAVAGGLEGGAALPAGPRGRAGTGRGTRVRSTPSPLRRPPRPLAPIRHSSRAREPARGPSPSARDAADAPVRPQRRHRRRGPRTPGHRHPGQPRRPATSTSRPETRCPPRTPPARPLPHTPASEENTTNAVSRAPG